ncbi:MAG: FKBP-type peptidyl-prolyl cis-trans isomerase [Bacteroidaceae bacterium]|nr:FKBP-type peptidyl-prolyl cis-trans isomerase [Bacteroidaceae bacterium]
MKKITMTLAAAAALVLGSCGSVSAPKAELENDLDTLCYAYGLGQSNGLSEYAFTERGLGLDSAYEAEFIKGIMEGANIGGSESKKAYYSGIAIGQQLVNQVTKGLKYEIFGPNDSINEVNLNAFMAGFISGAKKDSASYKFKMEEVEGIIRAKMTEVKAKAMEAQYGEYKKQNEEYMKKVAKDADVKPLADGVYYKVLQEGTGAVPTLSDRVKVNYEGKTIDNNIFDSTYRDGREPIELGVTQVIKGWTTALTSMPVGSKWELYIPSDAGYGAQESGPIKPFSTLVFTVELLEILK